MKYFIPIALLNCTFLLLHSSTHASENTVEPKFGLRANVSTDLELNPKLFCSGYETLRMPVLGKCPSGSVGIATCTQAHKIPYKLTIDLSSPSHTYTCELDYANMEPTGDIQCDYSRCLTIQDPRLFDIYFEGLPTWDFIWE